MPDSAPVPDDLLTPKQAATLLHVNVQTVRRWLVNGELPGSKVGPRRWVIKRADVEALAGAPSPPPPSASSVADAPTGFLSTLSRVGLPGAGERR